ncbi:MAG: Ig domain-containing protein [[Clostridium] symbiosum]
MKKRLTAVFLCLCLLFMLFPATAFASGEDSNRTFTDGSGLCEHHTQHDESCGYTEGTAEIPCSHEHNESCGGLTDPEVCNHSHDETCGYVPATEGTPCTFVCEVCNAQDSGNPVTPSDAQPETCTCETLCTEEEVNADCPVCSAEGAELDKVCVGAAPMLPVMPLAVDAPATLYVGETDITTGGYWKTTADGKLEPGSESDYNVHYDGNSILTLNNAKIQGRGNSGNPQPEDYGIYAAPTGNQSVSLTINLMGSNTVSGYCGICVETTTADNASLVIQPAENDPQGSLEAIGNKYNGITISSGSGNASLTINNAPVVAISKSPAPNSYHGVCIKTGNATAPALSLLVNGGSLTAQGESGYGIYFYMGYRTTDPSTSLTVQNNALVKATPSIVTSNNLSKPDTTAGSESGGIVFDGKNGTVYGDVELQDDLEIGTDETLTIPDGSSLDTNGNLTNSGTIINNGTLTGEVGGSGTVTPKITTDSLPNGTVGESYTATLEATGNNITWSSSGMPEWMTLGSSTGVISGTPTTADTYTFTVTATNASGSDSKEYMLNIKAVSVTSLKLNKDNLTLQEKGSDTLTATVEPADATNQDVTWKSSDTSIATVSADGTVTAISAGTATITATAQDGSGGQRLLLRDSDTWQYGTYSKERGYLYKIRKY